VKKWGYQGETPNGKKSDKGFIKLRSQEERPEGKEGNVPDFADVRRKQGPREGTKNQNRAIPEGRKEIPVHPGGPEASPSATAVSS